MIWNLSLLSGPWPVSGGVVFVIPADKVTADLKAYAQAVPAGVPVLAGVSCTALASGKTGIRTLKLAARYNGTSYWAATDGASLSVENGSFPVSPTQINLGVGSGLGVPLNGYLQRFTIWPTALSDAQLLAMTQ